MKHTLLFVRHALKGEWHFYCLYDNRRSAEIDAHELRVDGKITSMVDVDVDKGEVETPKATKTLLELV